MLVEDVDQSEMETYSHTTQLPENIPVADSDDKDDLGDKDYNFFTNQPLISPFNDPSLSPISADNPGIEITSDIPPLPKAKILHAGR